MLLEPMSCSAQLLLHCGCSGVGLGWTDSCGEELVAAALTTVAAGLQDKAEFTGDWQPRYAVTNLLSFPGGIRGQKEQLAACSCRESPKPSSVKTTRSDKVYLQTSELVCWKAPGPQAPKTDHHLFTKHYQDNCCKCYKRFSFPLWRGNIAEYQLPVASPGCSCILQHETNCWLKFCCVFWVQRALCPAQHCSTLAVRSQQNQWASGTQTIC